MTAPVTSEDLARFRVLFAVFVLVTLPSHSWASDYPGAMWEAPPGPLMLLSGPPPGWVLFAVNLGVAGCMVALIVGRWVGAVSVAAALLMGFGAGVTYGLGKIDHDILLVLTPAVMAAAGWSGRRAVSGLALRLWAFTIGLAMLSAGLVKVLAGWLDPSTHATYGSLMVFKHVDGREGPAADLALAWLPAAAWEAFDWAAVALECGLLLTVWSWRWFRVGLVALCLFHLGVLMLFGIAFVGNVVAYAAFFHWGRLARDAGLRDAGDAAEELVGHDPLRRGAPGT